MTDRIKELEKKLDALKAERIETERMNKIEADIAKEEELIKIANKQKEKDKVSEGLKKFGRFSKGFLDGMTLGAISRSEKEKKAK